MGPQRRFPFSAGRCVSTALTACALVSAGLLRVDGAESVVFSAGRVADDSAVAIAGWR